MRRRRPGPHYAEDTTDLGAIIVTEASLAFAEAYVPEDDVLADARRRALEVGVSPIHPGGGAALQLVVSMLGARAVAEIGTGTGVSGLYVLRGLAADGVLTSVDLEAENQRHAREVFTSAGIASQRFRLIAGGGLEVMPRLTQGGYDVVFIDADKAEYAEYLDQAIRLTRPGGVICVDNALWNDKVADPTQRDPQTLAVRELLSRVEADETLRPVLLPVGDGLLVAQRLS